MPKPFHIAIDGPVAAGKGTVARLVAERLGMLYVDTGAMYRATALLGTRNNVSLDDESGLAGLLGKTKIEMRNPVEKEQDGRLTTVLLAGEDVSHAIRTEEVSKGSSKVAKLREIRQILVEKQQKIAIAQDVVMEGRDITSNVLPAAQIKIYLTASDVVRAKRRHTQLLHKGISASFEDIYQDLIDRDKRDKERSLNPLLSVEDAWVIDTSDLSIEQVVNLIVARVGAMKQAS